VDLSLMDVLQKFRRPTTGTSLSTLNPVALGIVHRLDRGTSGCIIIAKNDPIHAQFVAAIFQRQLQKTYTVLVSPAPCTVLYNETMGYITIPVDGKPAKSKYTVLERFVRYNNISKRNETAALMNVITYTGRQHQVRVHCAHGLKAPIVGDPLYSITTAAPTTKTTIRTKNHNTKSLNRPKTKNVVLVPGIHDQSQERFHLHASSITLPFQLEAFHNSNNNSMIDHRTITYNAPIPIWWLPILDEWRQ
jgi:23S rRNA-/tRNA-specific pseudouridylate synthase